MCLGLEGGGFNGVLQPEAPAGWEMEIFPTGLAGTAAVLPMGPRRDEPTGRGRAVAEVGFHSVCTSAMEPHASKPDIAQAWLGDAGSAEDESAAA